VTVSTKEIIIKKKILTSHGKRRSKEIPIQHPIILLSHWMASILASFPKFFLGGLCPEVDGEKSYVSMFTRFWERFKSVDPSHPIYQKCEKQRGYTIPIALHGDEGRGLAKVPLLVLAYQVIIPYSGENELNSSKHHILNL